MYILVDDPGQEGLVFSTPELAATGDDRVTSDLEPRQRFLVKNNQIEFSSFLTPNIKLLLPPKPTRPDKTSAKPSLDSEDGADTPSDKIIILDPLSMEIKEALTNRELDSLKTLKRQSDALMDEDEGSPGPASPESSPPEEALSPPRVLSPPQVFPEDLRTAKSPKKEVSDPAVGPEAEPGSGSSSGEASGPVPGQVSGETPGPTTGPPPRKDSSPATVPVSGLSPGKVSSPVCGSTLGKVSGPVSGLIPGKVSGPVSGSTPGPVSGTTTGTLTGTTGPASGSAAGPARNTVLGPCLENKSLQDHPGGGVLRPKKR